LIVSVRAGFLVGVFVANDWVDFLASWLPAVCALAKETVPNTTRDRKIFFILYGFSDKMICTNALPYLPATKFTALILPAS
jgi:hypothetical protein